MKGRGYKQKRTPCNSGFAMTKGICRLRGYNAHLEERRRFYKRQLDVADNDTERREAISKLASVTSLRSATFISAYEYELGIGDG